MWHDARTQRLLAVWSVPLIVDGHRARLDGELRRFPAPSLWLWLGALACLLAGGAAPLLVRRRDLARAEATAFALVAAGASVVIVFAFALDSYASPGTWIVGFDAIAFSRSGSGCCCGPENPNVGAAIGVGLVAVAVGLLNGAVFLHPVVLAILPGTIIRLLVVAAIGAGLSAAALGCADHAVIATPARD